jgi:hypothetical protein
MEPITVIDLEPWAWEFLREHRSVRLAVIRQTEAFYNPDAENAPRPDMGHWIVNITAEVIRRGNHTSLMLFTNNEEAALLLKSDLLPGQYRADQERSREAFAKGFLSALNALR